MTHRFVIVDYTGGGERHCLVAGHFGYYPTKDQAREALARWQDIMNGNGRLYRIKAVSNDHST